VILVAGGTGHLGKELIPRLMAGGKGVRVLTRDTSRARRRLGDSPEFIEGDVRNPASLETAMRGIDTVVSAITGFGPGGDGPQAVDFKGNRNLIRAAEAAGAHRFMLLSMRGAAAAHPMELARMKHRAEDVLRASSLAWTILRPTPFMELWAGIVGDPIEKGVKTTVFGSGDNAINFIAERDVAQIVELAVTDSRFEGAVLDVGGPDNLSFNQLVGQIEAAVGHPAQVRHVPVPVMRLSALLIRPFRPDVAGMMEAAIGFATADMRYDAAEMDHRFPTVELSHMVGVVGLRFGRTALAANVA
jgi:NADH dehydrogenase